MTKVWEFSKHRGTMLLLLLAIADNANDDGEAYPGREYLAKKIRMSEAHTREMLVKLINSHELHLTHRGGSGTGDPHHYRITLKGRPASPSEKGRPASPKGEVKGRLRGGAHAQINQEPLRTLRTGDLTTSPPLPPPPPLSKSAAAAAVENGWWNLEGLILEGKINKARKIEIMALIPPPAVSAYVASYLYAMTSRTINVPSLFAAKRLLDEPGGFAGEPFDSLANLGPVELAKCLGWIADGGTTYLDGQMPLALALRGFMPNNSQPTIARAINELGLSALITKSEMTMAAAIVGDGDAGPVQPKPEPDRWQRLIAKLFDEKLNRSVTERLHRCQLISDDTGKLLVEVPTQIEFDWITNRLAENLSRYLVEFQLKGK